ncbi:hypothetical protein CEUSTIGMA_g2450.t1 [Chlamydomonas eustigma]|uniref:Uncharacterized protein n=1 Tax=Chlamydomonas eustigma TaxID=1157962 RepID=A0A250WVY9_9CHLO|nr:hypothetical protein CEUSTIGMA_g2450.t1 [Chlamydomonas eustigma]|eukprot:GAX75004.1 hypothetical protein CEUSTIGMA_g2450.t1 [Chlamydomonas eustigma]
MPLFKMMAIVVELTQAHVSNILSSQLCLGCMGVFYIVALGILNSQEGMKDCWAKLEKLWSNKKSREFQGSPAAMVPLWSNQRPQDCRKGWHERVILENSDMVQENVGTTAGASVRASANYASTNKNPSADCESPRRGRNPVLDDSACEHAPGGIQLIAPPSGASAEELLTGIVQPVREAIQLQHEDVVPSSYDLEDRFGHREARKAKFSGLSQVGSSAAVLQSQRSCVLHNLYVSKLRKCRVVFKVFNLEPEDIPEYKLKGVSGMLCERFPSWSITSSSVRRGCVILEVEIAERLRGDTSRKVGNSMSHLDCSKEVVSSQASADDDASNLFSRTSASTIGSSMTVSSSEAVDPLELLPEDWLRLIKEDSVDLIDGTFAFMLVRSELIDGTCAFMLLRPELIDGTCAFMLVRPELIDGTCAFMLVGEQMCELRYDAITCMWMSPLSSWERSQAAHLGADTVQLTNVQPDASAFRQLHEADWLSKVCMISGEVASLTLEFSSEEWMHLLVLRMEADPEGIEQASHGDEQRLGLPVMFGNTKSSRLVLEATVQGLPLPVMLRGPVHVGVPSGGAYCKQAHYVHEVDGEVKQSAVLDAAPWISVSRNTIVINEAFEHEGSGQDGVDQDSHGMGAVEVTVDLSSNCQPLGLMRVNLWGGKRLLASKLILVLPAEAESEAVAVVAAELGWVMDTHNRESDLLADLGELLRVSRCNLPQRVAANYNYGVCFNDNKTPEELSTRPSAAYLHGLLDTGHDVVSWCEAAASPAIKALVIRCMNLLKQVLVEME